MQRRMGVWLVALATVVSVNSTARADWITLSAGLAGSAAPTATDEFWFDTPHGPPLVAVDRVRGGTVEAHAGGSTVYFGGLGTPVLISLADGSAYLAGGEPPAASTGRGPGGRPAGPQTSALLQTGESIPSSAALLGVTLADPDRDGSRPLSVSVRDAAGATLGTAEVAVPDGGWWVIGLGPDQQPAPEPGPTDPPAVPTPPPEPAPTPGVPEPGTVALAAVGLAAVGLPALAPRVLRGRRAIAA